jgi:hypothetical protein
MKMIKNGKTVNLLYFFVDNFCYFYFFATFFKISVKFCVSEVLNKICALISLFSNFEAKRGQNGPNIRKMNLKFEFGIH